MPIFHRGRSVKRIVYFDRDLVRYNVLEAFLGERQVWDGRLHAIMRVPLMRATARMLPVKVSGGVSETIPLMAAWAEMKSVQVSASTDQSASLMVAVAQMFAPELHSEQTLDVPMAVATAGMLVPTIKVVAGITPPTMTAVAEMLPPSLEADSMVKPALATAYAQMLKPEIGSFARVDAPLMTASAVMLTPALLAQANVEVPRAAATAQMLAPTYRNDRTLFPPTAQATALFLQPTIGAQALPTYLSGTTSSGGTSTTQTVTIAAPGSLVVAQVSGLDYDNSNTKVTFNGVPMSQIGPNVPGDSAAVFAVRVSSAGSYEFRASRNFFSTILAVVSVFADPGTIGATRSLSGTSGTSASITPPDDADMWVGMFSVKGNVSASAATGTERTGTGTSNTGTTDYKQSAMITAVRGAPQIALSMSAAAPWEIRALPLGYTGPTWRLQADLVADFSPGTASGNHPIALTGSTVFPASMSGGGILMDRSGFVKITWYYSVSTSPSYDTWEGLIDGSAVASATGANRASFTWSGFIATGSVVGFRNRRTSSGSSRTIYPLGTRVVVELAPPLVARQRMDKSGNYHSGTNYDLKQVTGWVSDATYPSTVTNNKLVVTGAGLGTVTAVLDSQTDDNPVSGAVKLMHNDSVLATGDLTAYNNRHTLTLTASASFGDGDTIWLQTQTGSAIAAQIYAGSYIEVSPS